MDEKYSILGTTLKGIADAIRRKTGKTGGLVPESMEAEIDSVKTFDDLPDLMNAASAAHILSGFQALNGDGEVMEGTFSPRTFVSGTKSVSSKSNKITIPDLVGKENFVITLNVSGKPKWNDFGVLTMYKNGDTYKVMSIPTAGSGLGDMVVVDVTVTISTSGVITIKNPQYFFAPLYDDNYMSTKKTEYIYFGF